MTVDTRRWLDRTFLPQMGTIPLGRVRTEDVDRYYAERRRQELFESTGRRHHAMVRSMFSQGVRWGWLGVNPSTNTHRPPIVTATVHPPDPAVVAQLLKYAAGRDPHIYSFLVVAADTGARLGQLVRPAVGRLRRRHLERTLLFTRTLSSTGDIRPLSKTKGRALVVPLGVSTVRTLSVHRTSMKERALSFGVRLAKTSFLFSDDPAGRAPWKVDTFEHRYIKLRREAGAGPGAAAVNFHQAAPLRGHPTHRRRRRPQDGGRPARPERTSTTLDMYTAPVSEMGRTAADLLERIGQEEALLPSAPGETAA